MKNGDTTYQTKVAAAKAFYSQIKRVTCPAFDNEAILFNSLGFKHIIRKGRISRPKNDQLRRFHLLKYIIPILSNPELIPTYRQEEIRRMVVHHHRKERIKKSAKFWSFNKVYDDRVITVLIRQFEGGVKHFFSVMDNK